MTTNTKHEAEFLTRSIAQWGSVAAALVLGIGFVTDRNLSWQIVVNNGPVVGLVGVMFIGYAFAWTNRNELLGSLIALGAMLLICVYNLASIDTVPDYFPLAAGIPALFHLVAVTLHWQSGVARGT